MNVGGLVEVDEYTGSGKDDWASREVFLVASDAAAASEAADLIRRYSEEVCAQRAWIGYGGAS